jgi:hypothetical protein
MSFYLCGLAGIERHLKAHIDSDRHTVILRLLIIWLQVRFLRGATVQRQRLTFEHASLLNRLKVRFRYTLEQIAKFKKSIFFHKQKYCDIRLAGR